MHQYCYAAILLRNSFLCTIIVMHQYCYAPIYLCTNIVCTMEKVDHKHKKKQKHHQRFEVASPCKLLTLLTLLTLFTLFTFLHFLPSYPLYITLLTLLYMATGYRHLYGIQRGAPSMDPVVIGMARTTTAPSVRTIISWLHRHYLSRHHNFPCLLFRSGMTFGLAISSIWYWCTDQVLDKGR